MRPQSVKPLQREKTHLFHMQKGNMGNPYRSGSHQNIQNYCTKPVNCNLDQLSIFELNIINRIHVGLLINMWLDIDQ